jgi:hypothetical protein
MVTAMGKSAVQNRYSMLCACLLLAGPAIANDAPASDESIREMLVVTASGSAVS